MFETEKEANRFVEGAYPMFVVVPLPVYESYDDSPEDERYTDTASGLSPWPHAKGLEQ